MRLLKRDKSIHVDKKAEIGNRVLLESGGGTITIGKSYIGDFVKIHAAGGRCQIGNNVTIGAFGFLNAAGNIIIEDNVLCADKVNIVTENHGYADVLTPIRNQPCTNEEIVIGEGSWIGINSTILAGSKIGKNSVVGANSVVKGKFKDYCVIAGNPAKVIKSYNGQKWVKVKDGNFEDTAVPKCQVETQNDQRDMQ